MASISDRAFAPPKARLHADAREIPNSRAARAALHWVVLVSTACSRASDGQVVR